MYVHQMLLLGGGGGARAIEEAACHNIMFECTLTRCATTCNNHAPSNY